MEKIILPVKGMHCKSCEIIIEGNIAQIEGVKKVESSHISGQTKIWYEGDKPSYNSLCEAVEKSGYIVGLNNNKNWFSRNPRDYYYVINAVAILLLLFIVSQMLGLFSLAANFDSKNIAMAVVVGLIAGVSTCMALVGGLLLAMSAEYYKVRPTATTLQKFRPHLFFNLGRLIGFAAFGGLLGFIGEALRPSLIVMSILTVIVGLVMVVLGLKLVDIFPIVNRINITLPKFIAKFFGIQNSSREYSHTQAAIGGALTFFLPCGFTQAMQLYAISSASFIQGALVMSLFALGTAPGLLGIGGLTSVLKGTKARLFFATAGLAVIILGIFNITNASKILFPHQVAATKTINKDSPVQEVRMNQQANGYFPNQFTVKKGITVRWIITSTDQYTCASDLVIPSLKINKTLQMGENIVEFTPNQIGEIAFSCSMGMYRGKFTVID